MNAAKDLSIKTKQTKKTILEALSTSYEGLSIIQEALDSSNNLLQPKHSDQLKKTSNELFNDLARISILIDEIENSGI